MAPLAKSFRKSETDLICSVVGGRLAWLIRAKPASSFVPGLPQFSLGEKTLKEVANLSIDSR